MNTYRCLYKNKWYDVDSDTTYHAQQEIAKRLNVKKRYEISVFLAAKDGVPVIHIFTE